MADPGQSAGDHIGYAEVMLRLPGRTNSTARWMAVAGLFAVVSSLATVVAVRSQAGTTSAPAATPEASGHSVVAAAVARDGPPPEPRSVTVTAVGDVSLAREVVDRMQAAGADYPYALVLDLLAGDIVVGNFEGALTGRGEPWPKAYNFRTPPEYAAGLRAAGFDLVSLANNHAMDYGADGLFDTMAALEAAGVAFAGAGADESSAYRPVVVEAAGLRVAFVAVVATPDEGSGFSIWEWAPSEGSPGVAIGTVDAVSTVVAAARRRADFVVVMLHAGTEYSTAVDATQRALAEAAFAAGAVAVVGSHPHVPQAIEWREGKLVAWSLGNFIFDLDGVDLANIPAPRVTPVLEFTLTEGRGVTGVRVRAAVLDADEDRPRPASEEEALVLAEYTGIP